MCKDLFHIPVFEEELDGLFTVPFRISADNHRAGHICTLYHTEQKSYENQGPILLPVKSVGV